MPTTAVSRSASARASTIESAFQLSLMNKATRDGSALFWYTRISPMLPKLSTRSSARAFHAVNIASAMSSSASPQRGKRGLSVVMSAPLFEENAPVAAGDQCGGVRRRTDRRRAGGIGKIAAAPLRMIFVFKGAQAFVVVKAIAVLVGEARQPLLRFGITALADTGKRRHAEFEILIALRARVFEQLGEQQIHHSGRPAGQLAHELDAERTGAAVMRHQTREGNDAPVVTHCRDRRLLEITAIETAQRKAFFRRRLLRKPSGGDRRQRLPGLVVERMLQNVQRRAGLLGLADAVAQRLVALAGQRESGDRHQRSFAELEQREAQFVIEPEVAVRYLIEHWHQIVSIGKSAELGERRFEACFVAAWLTERHQPVAEMAVLDQHAAVGRVEQRFVTEKQQMADRIAAVSFEECARRGEFVVIRQAQRWARQQEQTPAQQRQQREQCTQHCAQKPRLIEVVGEVQPVVGLDATVDERPQ